MVGGGAKNRLLCQATADASGLPVSSFAVEGAAVGNLARQWLGLGAIESLPVFRAKLARQLDRTLYTPRR